LQETKELANVLLVLRQEGIKRLPDIDVKLGMLRTMVLNLKESAKKLEQKNLQYKEAAKLLRGYQSSFLYGRSIAKRGEGHRRCFVRIHESDLRAFEYIQAQLQKSDVKQLR
jgi:hypothetical protein